uniref:Twitchin n=1 Tax=Cacopsylla melanoneura TaxID=428564 RepID=A0A8D8WUR1_9HEMI
MMSSSSGQEPEQKGKKKSMPKVSKAPPLKQETIENIARVPAKPEGPLKIEDNTVLKWQAPSHDGGAPILKYIVAQESPPGSGTFKELRKQNSDPETCVDLDENLHGDNYDNILFRISAVNLKGSSDPLEESISVNKSGSIVKNSTLRFDAVEFVPSPCSNNVSHVSLTCEPNLYPYSLDMNGSYENADYSAYDYDTSGVFDQTATYEKDIDAVLEECIQNLSFEPRQFERFIEEQNGMFGLWLECPSSCMYAATRIIEMSSQSSDNWHNFRYFGAKICSQMINLDKTSAFFYNVINSCAHFVSMIERSETNPCIKGFMLFLAELYKLLEGNAHNVQVGQLLLKALHTLVSLPYDAQNSKITIVVTILKCCGFLLYPNHTKETEELFIPLQETKALAQCTRKDATMIESLENCYKSWKEDAQSNVSCNGDGNNEDSISRTEEVFYGPDGSTTYVTLEESQFFEDSYRELDDGMSEEMQEEYEKFLAEIPNGR